MTGSLLHKVNDILDNITMNDDQHHDNSLISVLGQNALFWLASYNCSCDDTFNSTDLPKDFLALPRSSRSELVCPGDDPTTNSAASIPCFQASLVTSLNIDTVSKLSYMLEVEPPRLTSPSPPFPSARQTHITHIDCNHYHCDFLTRPISSLPAWTTTPRPMMLLSPFRES